MQAMSVQHDRILRSYAIDSRSHVAYKNTSNNNRGGK